MILAGALAAATAAVLFVLALHPPGLSRLARPRVPVRIRDRLRRGRAGAAALAILQATHAGLRSGLPLAAALRAALEPHDAFARGPFEQVVRALELNASIDDAVALVRENTFDRRVRTALDALGLASLEDLTASRSAALLASVAERLAFEAHLRSEVDARASGVRWQITVLALVVPCFALYLVATMPGLAATLSSPLATHLLIPLAVALEIAGIVLSRSAVSGLEL